jgi:hypothetical protein
MSGYGEPEWVNPSQSNNNSTTVADANVGEGVTAQAPE